MFRGQCVNSFLKYHLCIHYDLGDGRGLCTPCAEGRRGLEGQAVSPVLMPRNHT